MLIRCVSANGQLTIRLGKRALFTAVAFVLTVAAAETIAWYGLQCVDEHLGLRPVYAATDARYIREFILSTWVNLALGWDMPTACRPDTHLVPGQPLFATVYGNSYAYGDEVGDSETWEYQFNAAGNERIANLGINGAGTDQAYLKFCTYQDSFPSAVAILSILPENINRVVSYVRKFYYMPDLVFYVKPRFVCAADGTVSLLPVPLTAREEYFRLLDPKVMRQAAQHDYWYRYLRQQYAYDPITGRRPPYTLALLATALRAPAAEDVYSHHRTLWRDTGSEGFRIMQYLVTNFAAAVRARGGTPVIMTQTGPDGLDEYAHMEPFLHWVQAQGLTLFNARAELLAAIAGGEVTRAELFAPRCHYRREANAVIAARLRTFLAARGLLPARGAARVQR